MRNRGLSENAERVSIVTLNAALADLIDFAANVKQAHWTLHGLTFIAVHELLDGLRDRLDEHIDTLAERIVALRGTPVGTIRAAASQSRVPPYDEGLTSISGHLEALSDRLDAICARIRLGIEQTASAADQVTADILTGVARGLDKDLWLLEAHLPA